MDLNQFIKDRKEAVLSADLNMIKAYCKKYGVPLPPSGDIPLMRGMQLCVFRLTDVPYKEKRDAWTNYSVRSRDMWIEGFSGRKEIIAVDSGRAIIFR